MPGRRTRIDAGHIIAYQDGGHRYLKDGVVVVGGPGDRPRRREASDDGPADETIDARGMLADAGPDLHPRPPGRLAARQVVHRGSGAAPVLQLGPVRVPAGARRGPGRGRLAGLRRLLDGRAAAWRRHDRPARSGRCPEYTVERAIEAGIRLYMGPGYRSGRWYTRTAARWSTSGTRRRAGRACSGRSSSSSSTTAQATAWSRGS